MANAHSLTTAPAWLHRNTCKLLSTELKKNGKDAIETTNKGLRTNRKRTIPWKENCMFQVNLFECTRHGGNVVQDQDISLYIATKLYKHPGQWLKGCQMQRVGSKRTIYNGCHQMRTSPAFSSPNVVKYHCMLLQITAYVCFLYISKTVRPDISSTTK